MENQLSAFRNFIADDEVDVIILAALEAAGWDAVLQEAKDAGKTVVLEDRRIDAPEDLYATYIGSDFTLEGRKAADEMCVLLGEGPHVVWELVGNVGSSAAIDRGKGFRENMGACGITIPEEFTQTGDWSATKGKEVTQAFLQKSTDVDGIFAQNDEMGLGAIQALEEAGLKPAEDVKLITVDATKGAFEAMIAGKINTVVECNPLLAPQVYEAALKAVNGETLPKWVPSNESVFYQEDAAEILPDANLLSIPPPPPSGSGATPASLPDRSSQQTSSWVRRGRHDAAPVHAPHRQGVPRRPGARGRGLRARSGRDPRPRR